MYGVCFDNISIAGGPAPARAYIDELLPDVLEENISPAAYDVLLVATDDLNDEIDAAYRAKYHRYAESIISANARAATLKLVPR